jgi:hypothetical protein
VEGSVEPNQLAFAGIPAATAFVTVIDNVACTPTAQNDGNRPDGPQQLSSSGGSRSRDGVKEGGVEDDAGEEANR